MMHREEWIDVRRQERLSRLSGLESGRKEDSRRKGPANKAQGRKEG